MLKGMTIYSIGSSWNIFSPLEKEESRNVLVTLFLCYWKVETSVQKLVLQVLRCQPADVY